MPTPSTQPWRPKESATLPTIGARVYLCGDPAERSLDQPPSETAGVVESFTSGDHGEVMVRVRWDGPLHRVGRLPPTFTTEMLTDLCLDDETVD